MLKRILFIAFMVVITYFVSFAVMYNETLDSINTIINNAIETNDYIDILRYNSNYIDTPMYYFENDDYVVQINNSYSEETQSLTIIVVDRLKTQGEESELSIVCGEETYSYTNLFSEYEDAFITVMTLFEEGEGTYSLEGNCSLNFFENLLVKSNDGTVIVSLDNEVGFVDEQDILNDSQGFTAEEVESMQYPNGTVKPLILPIGLLWISVFALIYIYKKFFKKNNI